MNDNDASTKAPLSADHDSTGQGSGRQVATVVYALQAVSFIIGLTFFIAVIINYVKKEDVQGTWIESHFRWQIRTFWYTLLWSLLGALTIFVVAGYLILLGTMLWLIYRIVKGWLRLADGKPMYADA